MRRTVLTLGTLALAIAFASCFESVNSTACPQDCQYPFEGYCFATPPDGFVAPDGFAGSCSTSMECGTSMPVCKQQICQVCTALTDDAVCASRSMLTPRCHETNGTCVQCRKTTQVDDCGGQVCGDDGLCRACRVHTECASRICKADGTCAMQGDIAYVDNGGQPAATCALAGTHDGTQANPLCDIQNAITMTTKGFVLVMASAAPYGAVSINNRNVVLVGPGGAAMPTATIQGALSQGIVVQGTSSVTIDGFEVTSAAGTKEGILCSTAATASLTVLRNNVHNNGGVGISAIACTLVVDANLIGPQNGGGGLLFGTGSQYTATNNLIFRNSSTGVTIDKTAAGTFTFNTVAGNGGAGVAGGFDCGTAQTKVIEDSIVAGNTTAGAPATQLAGSCSLVNVVVGLGEMGAQGIKLDPTFVNTAGAPYSYRLTNVQANLDCCVDKIPAAPGLPNHDVDFTVRPKGAGWDIGAHELQ